MPEADVLLAQCAIYLARAPKSREADSALAAAKAVIKNFQGPQPSVPMHIRNAPTKLMKDLGKVDYIKNCYEIFFHSIVFFRIRNITERRRVYIYAA